MNDTTKQKCKNNFFLGKTLLSESIAEFRKLHQARPRGDFRLTTLSSRLCMLAGSNAGIDGFQLYIDKHKKFLFSHSSRFKAHISFSFFTWEEPYICQECETNLSRSRNLNRHERTPTGKKPYQCPKCGTGFSRSIYLNLHEHTHTGEKPYQCKESEYFFLTKN